jgi:hypothetical protein
MFYSSLAVLALAASAALPAAALPSVGNPVHLHPGSQKDTRVTVELLNRTDNFRDVLIGGQSYTIHAHELVNIKAPAGTVIYVNSYMPHHHRGDALLSITPADNNTKVVLD